VRFTIKRKLFYSHFIAVILVSGSIGTFFYKSAVDSLFANLQSRLRNSAALISRSIDANDLAEIRNPGDVTRPAYLKYLGQLREYRSANKDIAFIYVMRLEGKNVVFVIDSDSSAEQALPGRVYDADVPNLLAGFSELKADQEILCDEWGCFLSGYAPLKNGNGRYLVGIDMRADEVRQKFSTIRLTGLISLLLSILLAFVFSRVLAVRITRPIRLFVKRSAEIAEGHFVGKVNIESKDELGDLARAFNTMSDRLSQSHEGMQSALHDLEDSRSNLEHRVRERTARLAELNDQLLAEIEERKRAEAALEKAATTDYLTRLHNRRSMISILNHEMGRMERSGKESSLIMLDIDEFKKVNDNFGHEAGDAVLRHLGKLLKSLVRKQDVIARWGGEELLIMLPETEQEGAAAVAEKLRSTVADQPLEFYGQPIRVTISLGVSRMGKKMSMDECIRKADQALYRAKSEGRNKTVVMDGY